MACSRSLRGQAFGAGLGESAIGGLSSCAHFFSLLAGEDSASSRAPANWQLQQQWAAFGAGFGPAAAEEQEMSATSVVQVPSRQAPPAAPVACSVSARGEQGAEQQPVARPPSPPAPAALAPTREAVAAAPQVAQPQAQAAAKQQQQQQQQQPRQPRQQQQQARGPTEEQQRKRMLRKCAEQAALLDKQREALQHLGERNPWLVLGASDIAGRHVLKLGAGSFACVWASKHDFRGELSTKRAAALKATMQRQAEQAASLGIIVDRYRSRDVDAQADQGAGGGSSSGGAGSAAAAAAGASGGTTASAARVDAPLPASSYSQVAAANASVGSAEQQPALKKPSALTAAIRGAQVGVDMGLAAVLKVLQLPIGVAQQTCTWPQAEAGGTDSAMQQPLAERTLQQLYNAFDELRWQCLFIKEAMAMVSEDEPLACGQSPCRARTRHARTHACARVVARETLCPCDAPCAQVVCEGHPGIARCLGWCMDDAKWLPTIVMEYGGALRCSCASGARSDCTTAHERPPRPLLARRRRQPVAHAVWQQPAAPAGGPAARAAHVAAGRGHVPAAAGRRGLDAPPPRLGRLLPAPRHLARQRGGVVAARRRRPAQHQAGRLWPQRGEDARTRAQSRSPALT